MFFKWCYRTNVIYMPFSVIVPRHSFLKKILNMSFSFFPITTKKPCGLSRFIFANSIKSCSNYTSDSTFCFVQRILDHSFRVFFVSSFSVVFSVLRCFFFVVFSVFCLILQSDIFVFRIWKILFNIPFMHFLYLLRLNVFFAFFFMGFVIRFGLSKHSFLVSQIPLFVSTLFVGKFFFHELT